MLREACEKVSKMTSQVLGRGGEAFTGLRTSSVWSFADALRFETNVDQSTMVCSIKKSQSTEEGPCAVCRYVGVGGYLAWP